MMKSCFFTVGRHRELGRGQGECGQDEGKRLVHHDGLFFLKVPELGTNRQNPAAREEHVVVGQGWQKHGGQERNYSEHCQQVN